MICKLGQEYTRDFLERYDTYLMETRDKEAYRNKGKKKTTVKTVYGEVEYERRIYQVTREDGLSEFVFLLDEQLEHKRRKQSGKNTGKEMQRQIKRSGIKA